MGLFSSDLKIQETVDKTVKLFAVTYPVKSGKPVSKGSLILDNILKNDSVIVNIDTSFSFLDNSESSKYAEELRSMLRDRDIHFDYRVTEAETQAGLGGLLGQFLGFGKKSKSREIVTFELPKLYNDKSLLTLLLKLCPELYIPIEYNSQIAQEIFNCHFQDLKNRFSTFKYVAYLNEYLGQTAIRTTVLNLNDVKALCAN